MHHLASGSLAVRGPPLAEPHMTFHVAQTGGNSPGSKASPHHSDAPWVWDFPILPGLPATACVTPPPSDAKLQTAGLAGLEAWKCGDAEVANNNKKISVLWHFQLLLNTASDDLASMIQHHKLAGDPSAGVVAAAFRTPPRELDPGTHTSEVSVGVAAWLPKASTALPSWAGCLRRVLRRNPSTAQPGSVPLGGHVEAVHSGPSAARRYHTLPHAPTRYHHATTRNRASRKISVSSRDHAWPAWGPA